MTKIDKSIPIPLHYQLRIELEKKIKEGHFEENTKFFSESEICEMYSVSNTTVRQALREMIKDGLLIKEELRGRLRVARPKVNQNLTRLYGFFTEDVLNSGMQPITKVLSLEEVHDARILSQLGLDDNEKAYEVYRLHEGGGVPLALQKSFIAEKVFPKITELDLSKSIFKYMSEYFELSITRAIQNINVRFPTSKEKELLKLDSKMCVFQINRKSFAEDGTVIDYFECVMSGDRYNLTMEWNGKEPYKQTPQLINNDAKHIRRAE